MASLRCILPLPDQYLWYPIVYLCPLIRQGTSVLVQSVAVRHFTKYSLSKCCRQSCCFSLHSMYIIHFSLLYVFVHLSVYC